MKNAATRYVQKWIEKKLYFKMLIWSELDISFPIESPPWEDWMINIITQYVIRFRNSLVRIRIRYFYQIRINEQIQVLAELFLRIRKIYVITIVWYEQFSYLPT